MKPLPHLDLAPADPDFDEAVITINGHEEETITIECENARELAARLVELVNSLRPAPITAEIFESLNRRST